MFPPPLPTPWVFGAHSDPPAYTRPLVGSELSMQRRVIGYDGQSEVCCGINFTSSLGIEALQDRARGALDKLRFVCPIIACNIEDVVYPRWVYTPSADRQAWLHQALVIEERGKSLNPSEFICSINHRKLPYVDANGVSTLFRAYLLTASKGGNEDIKEYGLYFHGSHSMFDIGPAYHALNLMCEWMSGEGMEVTIEPSEEWRNLPVDPVTATGGPAKEWETNAIRVFQKLFEHNARPMRCHSLLPPSQPVDRSEPQFCHIIALSESETTAIISKTKQLGLSVAALFYAAHCLALIEMNPIAETANIYFASDLASVSLERYLCPAVNPKTHLVSALTVFPLGFSMASPLSEPTEKARLIATATLVKEHFDRYLADPCVPHVVVEAERLVGPIQGKAKEPMSPWTCSFQSLGKMESRLRTEHGKLSVGSIGFGSRWQTNMRVHLWTMHSKFHFQVQGAVAWGEDRMKTVLEEMLRIGRLILDEN